MKKLISSLIVLLLTIMVVIPALASNVNYVPLEDDYLQELTSSLGDDVTDLTISIDTTPVYLPSTTDTLAILEPGTTRAELVIIDSYDSSAGTLTVKAAGRGQDLYFGDARGTKIFEHPGGSEIMISNNFGFWSDYQTAIDSKLDAVGTNTSAAFDLDLSTNDFRIRYDSGDMKFTDDNQAEVTLSSLASLSGSNDKVKTSNADTTENYLQDKFNASDGLDEAIGSPAGNETLDVSVDVTDFIDTSFGLTESSNNIQIDLATNPGLQFTAGKLDAKLKSGGGLTKDADGISSVTDDFYTTDYTYGETIAAGDVLYHKRSDNKVYKVTSSVDTWDTIIGVADESGVDTDTGKRIKTKGLVTGSFSAILPTFTASGGSADIDIGSSGAARHGFGFALDNTAGAEALIDSIDLSVKKTGAPSTNLFVDIVLGDANRPGWGSKIDATSQVGASLASASITAASVSGVYEDYNFDFSDVAIPANSYVWIVVYMKALAAGDYYSIEAETSGGNAHELITDTNNSNWRGAGVTTDYLPNHTINMTSINPWDKRYAVRAYNGTDGGYGIGEEAGTSPFGRVIGHVMSSTEWFIDMDRKDSYQGEFTDGHVEDTEWFYQAVTTNFRPSIIDWYFIDGTNSLRTLANSLSNDTTAFNFRGHGADSVIDTISNLQAAFFEDGIHFYARSTTSASDNWSNAVNLTISGTYTVD